MIVVVAGVAGSGKTTIGSLLAGELGWEFEDGDWFGTPVVEASRLCAAATGDQILVSDLVRALAGSRTEFDVIPLGSRELKGLPAPLTVWRSGFSNPSSSLRRSRLTWTSMTLVPGSK